MSDSPGNPTVYVDWMSACLPNKRWPWREACHMFVENPEDLPALHEMANRLGLKRSWFQNHNRIPHYDLTRSKREQAIRLGCVEIASREQWSGMYEGWRAHALKRFGTRFKYKWEEDDAE